MLTHDLKEYARVSDILKRFSDYSTIDPEVLKRKQDIGIGVHTAIADDILEELPVLNSNTIGYFKSYALWREAVSAKFVMSERRFFCDKMMITGQIDALVKFSEHELFPVLVDFKTSVQESKIVWPMQAHLYYYLLTENDISLQKRFLFLKLDKDGAYPKVYEYVYTPNILAKCMNAIDLFWEEKRCTNLEKVAQN